MDERKYNPSTTVTIANGASLSDAAQIAEFINASVILPSGWTTQAITFQGSQDNTTFANVYDKDGVEVTIPGAVASASYEIPAAVMNHKFIKIRSGTAASPQNQAGGDILTIAAKS